MTENPTLAVTSITHGLSITKRGNCTAPATAVIEGYTRRAGRPFGSLDLSLYACDDHRVAAHTSWLPAEMHGYHDDLPDDAAPTECGRTVDYRGLPDTPGARIA